MQWKIKMGIIPSCGINVVQVLSLCAGDIGCRSRVLHVARVTLGYAGVTSDSRRSSRSELIVVASLVDKAPNLGGLARTCEIFHAQHLVVSDMDVVNQRDFTLLSMTAEKWVSIKAVAPASLATWLAVSRPCCLVLMCHLCIYASLPLWSSMHQHAYNYASVNDACCVTLCCMQNHRCSCLQIASCNASTDILMLLPLPRGRMG